MASTTVADEAAQSSMSTWEQATGENADEPQWRQEVAARLHNYHSRRRKRPPRYPSLALKFDQPVYSAAPRRVEAAPPATYQDAELSEAATAAAIVPEPIEDTQLDLAETTNVIEFPRPLIPPPARPDELAEPVLDLPRILDAPETVPKQVPLGGITLDEEEGPERSELELPLQVAPLGKRVLAAALDGLLVSAATLMFALIANKVAALLPSAHVLLSLGVALPATFWAVFQYIFLVYAGATPGMRVIGLRLSCFDDSVPDRSTRRWRALAMALSAVSLGLGFLWCLLDEDTLCWHDRITRTYLHAGPCAERRKRQGSLFPQQLFAYLRRVDTFLQRRAEETEQPPTVPPQG
ncbi:MAG TPA: RDD family protein [Terriglobales bacterium]|nr:RDD family protein [Terriglobales bacterium]